MNFRPMMTPGLIVAGTRSGSGKTVITLAIIRALRRLGWTVSSAKVGPDYIDPGYHSVASGRRCVNLDCWAMRTKTLVAIYEHLAHQSDYIICEGVMGLFDGTLEGNGSTADLAAYIGWPIVLVVDVTGQAASAVALLKGFLCHRSDINIAGIIFNRVGSDGHEFVLRESMQKFLPHVPILGALRKNPQLELPNRHLGLVQAGEHKNLNKFIEAAADTISVNLNLELILELSQKSKITGGSEIHQQLSPLGQRISIARDGAFAFSYPTVLDSWKRAGIELKYFSPLADEAPDKNADAIYLPGGYPELHAARLSTNQNFFRQLREAASRGVAIYGECGGYMVLGEILIDANAREHKMAGLLPLKSSFSKRLLHLGYRRATTLLRTCLGHQGIEFRGHEFHYASVISEGPGASLIKVTDARGENEQTGGLVQGSVAGSFVHLIDRAP